MKLFSFVLSAFAVISYARALPNSGVDEEHAAAGSTASNATVRFRTPCGGCSSGNVTTFEVTLLASDLPCGSVTDNILVNAVHLQHSQNPAGDNIGYEQLTVPSQTTYEPMVVDTVWLQTCRHDQLATLALAIIPTSNEAGSYWSREFFIISYKHGLAPEINSIFSNPYLDSSSADEVSFWSAPKVAEVALGASNSQSSSERDYLKDIKQHLLQLSYEYQERKILSLVSEEFGQCNGMACYLQTAFRKVPDLWELADIHFRHWCLKTYSSFKHHPCHTQNVTVLEGERPEGATRKIVSRTSTDTSVPTPNVLVGSPSTVPAPAIATPTPVRNSQSDARPTALTLSPGDAHQASPSHLDPPEEQHSPFPFDPSNADNPPSEAYHPNHPPWSHHGRPNTHSSSPDDLPFSSSHHRHRRPKIKHPAPRHKHFRLILGLAGGISSTLIVIALIKLLRHYCMNPRVRADRLARIEECRNKRAYKRAARQYRFRQLIGRFRVRRRGDSSPTDYEEKRAMLRRPTDDVPTGNLIQADINSLRHAHEIVSELVRAEEGRSRQPQSIIPQHQQQPILPHEFPVHPNTHTHSDDGSMSTLPPYAPPPPRYSTELSRDTEVVDGFAYTPTPSAAAASSASSFVFDDESGSEDGVPPTECESSIVDCRSRISVETERTGQSTDEKRGRGSLELAGERYRRDFN